MYPSSHLRVSSSLPTTQSLLSNVPVANVLLAAGVMEMSKQESSPYHYVYRFGDVALLNKLLEVGDALKAFLEPQQELEGNLGESLLTSTSHAPNSDTIEDYTVCSLADMLDSSLIDRQIQKQKGRSPLFFYARVGGAPAQYVVAITQSPWIQFVGWLVADSAADLSVHGNHQASPLSRRAEGALLLLSEHCSTPRILERAATKIHLWSIKALEESRQRESTVVLGNPSAHSIPFALSCQHGDAPFAQLFQCFDVQAVQRLLSLAVAGQSILFCDHSFARPSQCCLALAAAIYPLQWPGMLSPTLPDANVIPTLVNRQSFPCQDHRRFKALLAGIRSTMLPELLFTLSLQKPCCGASAYWTVLCDCSSGSIGYACCSGLVTNNPLQFAPPQPPRLLLIPLSKGLKELIRYVRSRRLINMAQLSAADRHNIVLSFGETMADVLGSYRRDWFPQEIRLLPKATGSSIVEQGGLNSTPFFGSPLHLSKLTNHKRIQVETLAQSPLIQAWAQDMIHYEQRGDTSLFLSEGSNGGAKGHRKKPVRTHRRSSKTLNIHAKEPLRLFAILCSIKFQRYFADVGSHQLLYYRSGDPEYSYTPKFGQAGKHHPSLEWMIVGAFCRPAESFSSLPGQSQQTHSTTLVTQLSRQFTNAGSHTRKQSDAMVNKVTKLLQIGPEQAAFVTAYENFRFSSQDHISKAWHTSIAAQGGDHVVARVEQIKCFLAQKKKCDERTHQLPMDILNHFVEFDDYVEPQDKS